MDVSKKFGDGERQYFSEMMEGYKVSCVKILMFGYITNIGIYLKYCTPDNVVKWKCSKKVDVSKNVCDGEHQFFWNKGGI